MTDVAPIMRIFFTINPIVLIGLIQIYHRPYIFDARPEIFPDLFYATCGGMGLTGFIFSATIKLKRINSSKIIQGIQVFKSLEEVCESFERFSSANYSVAWVDTIATGKNFGRSIFF